MKECDLVMRGGVTSGIVYPKALITLSREYRFRQVGGASAGAIAAAFAASAEYGRENTGFSKLEILPRELENGVGFLFRPYHQYTRLYNNVYNLMLRGRRPNFWFFLRNFLLIRKALAGLPTTNFGICPGTTTGIDETPGLIDWMNRQLEFIAGRINSPQDPLPEEPLTFGLLKKKGINLKLVTTNLSQNIPESLPIGEGFKVKSQDLTWLLPTNVSQWIIGRSASRDSGGLVDVPSGDEMPVLLAVRMSLSFPVLFSAIPLYSRDFSLRGLTDECSKEEEKYHRNFFSDGGLSSNFPIHYFDAIIPTRPTFGINLTAYAECRNGVDTEDLWNRIYMPTSAGAGMTYGVNSILKLSEFCMSLLSSAKDWQDSVQMRMPGYRERVVHIALKEDEGGLNLTMSGERIARLLKLGDLAGERILKGHGVDRERELPFSFEAHRWRRLLTATEALDGAFAEFAAGFTDQTPSGEPTAGSIEYMLDRLEQEYKQNEDLFQGLGYRPNNIEDIQKLRSKWELFLSISRQWDQIKIDKDWNLPSPSAAIKLRSSRALG